MWYDQLPDGRPLVLRRTDSGWLATCLSRRAEAGTAEEAIREAAGAPVDGTRAELDEWIAEHVAELEAADQS
jgi:hypothetical protein